MGQFYETIPESLIPWILAQKMIFIGSAPLSGSGHINISPKGGSYFGVVDARTFWYQDLTGSGIETISHLHEPGNGRIVVMLNAFEGGPRIVRLWGKGTPLEYGTPAYDAFVKAHDVKTIDGTRAIVVVDIHQVGTSCGFSVPFYDFKEFRPTLNDFFVKRVAAEKAGHKKDGIERYWAYKNAWSMDNLPGMKRGLATAEVEQVEPISKMKGPFAPTKPYALPAVQRGFTLMDLLSVLLIGFVAGVVGVILAVDKGLLHLRA